MAIKVVGKSKAEIENNTRFLRRVFDMENPISYCDIVRLLELKLSSYDEDFSFEVRTADKMDGRMAFYDIETNTIVVELNVYNRAVAGSGRDRFTLAHEFGHYWLHSSEGVVLARYDSNENIRAFEDPEWQANTFASHLLIPRTNLNEFDSIDDIAIHYGTSRQAAEIAYKDVKKPN